jgi:DNA polymerase III delta subunit
MAEKVMLEGQQTTRNGQTVTTTLNGQKKKMKNSPVYKTVLAPNAPWPKWDKIPQKIERVTKTVRINFEKASLDYFLETHEELNKSKTASKSRTRDKLSGRFTSN